MIIKVDNVFESRIGGITTLANEVYAWAKERDRLKIKIR